MVGEEFTSTRASQVAYFGETAVTLHASSGETIAGQTADFDFGQYHCAQLVVDVTALGTPGAGADDIVFFFEAKDPLSGKYYTHATFTITEAIIPETEVVFLDESTATLPTAPANFAYLQAHPLIAGTYRLRWAPATSGPTWTFSAGIVLKQQ